MEKMIYMIDLDGTMWEFVPLEVIHETGAADVMEGAVEWVNKKYDEGNYICFFTARSEQLRKITQDKIDSLGVKYHQLLMNKPRLKNTNFGGYHYIDDCRVLKSTRYDGNWDDMPK
ncbi:MAG: phosphoheptose isomerase [bacterium]|nr:phosphoheptose isomerase [bacterium]